jgi:hypothetical protein
MNTRSRARVEREDRRNSEKQRRVERRQRLESRVSLGTPYNLRTRMGRRGVTSSKGTGRDSRGDKTFDISEVAPVVLFPVSEEDNEVDKGGSEVMLLCEHKEIVLFAK